MSEGVILVYFKTNRPSKRIHFTQNMNTKPLTVINVQDQHIDKVE